MRHLFLRFPAYLILIVASLCSATVSGKEGNPIVWLAKPVLHSIPDSFKKQSAAFILDERQIEIVMSEKDAPAQYRTVHRIIRLIDEKGVEAFNTFTIPLSEGKALSGIKARTILPGGKVIEVAPDQIREMKNEEGQREYRVALEGVEKGAEVELLYTEQREMGSFGSEVYQFGVPGLQGIFRIIAPDHLRYDARGYNGFSDLKDSVYDGLHHYSAFSNSIPMMEDETYSRYRPNLQRIDYKLSYVAGDNGNVRLQTWTDLAKGLHRTYRIFTDKEQRVAEKLIERIGVKPEDPELKKVLRIEDYFKSNIIISTNLNDDDVLVFNHIVDKKLTTERGYMRFFAACLNAADVKFEIGLMPGRYSYPMDESLEIWDHLDIFAIYLPALKGYLAPTAVTFRYPFVPYIICGDKGLFTKTTSLGNMVSALPDMRTIPHAPMEKNGNAIIADVKFTGEDLTPTVTITNSYHGYSSDGLRAALLFGAKDKEKEFVQNVTGLAEKESDIESYTVENTAFSHYSTGEPLKLTTVVQVPKLMEKAGPKYLFKAGDLIGRQVELYHDDNRVLPIEVEYPHTLPRKLRIHVPAGYKVVNPEAVRFNVVFTEGGKDLCGFRSDYTMDGSTLVIDIYEFYDQMSYPVSGYETFRKVINAAADFNKVVLVMQKV